MIKEIEVTFVADHYAFAIVQDDYSQAYVPASVMNTLKKIRVGSRYKAGLVENKNNDRSHATPWFVTYIPEEEADEVNVFSPLKYMFNELTEAPEPEETVSEIIRQAIPELTLSEIIRQAIPEMNGKPFIASELAAVAGVSNRDASGTLNNMFISGEVSCAKIYRNGGQVKSTQTVWCSDVNELLK